MGAAESTFRGYWSIKEVTDNMDRLANWMVANKPECGVMTLQRKDYDLLKRWPKAAQVLNVTFAESGEPCYRGFELHYDNKPPRYVKKS
jgi:hypothetical protein